MNKLKIRCQIVLHVCYLILEMLSKTQERVYSPKRDSICGRVCKTSFSKFKMKYTCDKVDRLNSIHYILLHNMVRLDPNMYIPKYTYSVYALDVTFRRNVSCQDSSLSPKQFPSLTLQHRPSISFAVFHDSFLLLLFFYN